MEKIGADDIYQDLQDGCLGWDNQYYPAPDVDDLLAAVRGLVDAGTKIHDRICDLDAADDGWFYPAIYVDDFVALKQALDEMEKLGKTS